MIAEATVIIGRRPSTPHGLHGQQAPVVDRHRLAFDERASDAVACVAKGLQGLIERSGAALGRPPARPAGCQNCDIAASFVIRPEIRRANVILLS